MLCRSERKTSRFTWFVDGHMITSPYKVATNGRSGESVLLLTSHDFSGEFAYVTCFVPPFTPKRVKVNLAAGEYLGFPANSVLHLPANISKTFEDCSSQSDMPLSTC